MPTKQLSKLLEQVAPQDTIKSQEIIESIGNGGPAAVKKLVNLVGDEFGADEGVKPKYALHGLVIHASRPGADDERKMVAETLAKELDAQHSGELAAFIIRQLQLCGRADEVPALAKRLTSDRLCDPAAQALSAIGGDAALEALRKALPEAKGKRKTTIDLAVKFLSGK